MEIAEWKEAGKPLNTIVNCECLKGMRQMADNSVDTIITDPPYNISKLNDNRSKLNSPIIRRESPLKYDFGEWDNLSRTEFLDFTKSWLKECCRVLKEGGTIISFFNKEDISFLGWEAKDLGIRTRSIISWHKTNPVPSFRKVNYLSACEFLWVGSKGEKAWTFNFKQQKEMHNFFETPNSSSYGETEHPTEKPLKLLKHLIEIHTNENDIVLDPFMGSGTTAVACIQTGRQYIGFELSEDYCKMSEARIKATQPPLKQEYGSMSTGVDSGCSIPIFFKPCPFSEGGCVHFYLLYSPNVIASCSALI
ncbi:MAG: site-specific DNA-methyltransferase [Nanoarchaeota archaeon]|nr:site-specific DNA-methyltransferase [Nanoarchaeota archaeon]